MRPPFLPLAALLAGVLVGLVAARLGGEPDPPDGAALERPPTTDRRAPDPDATRPPAAGLEPAGARAPAPAEPAEPAPPAEPNDDALLSATLLAYARDGFVLGWRRERVAAPTESQIGEGLARFEEEVLALPARLGADHARRENDRDAAAEDARTGGVFALLGSVDAGGVGPVHDQVRDRATFDRFFRRDAPEAATNGEVALGRREPPADGTTLTFGGGVFAMPDLGRRWGEIPADLTIAGAGRDATLLVLESDVSAGSRVRNLTLRDCTVHTNDDYLFDVRRPAMSVTVRDARIVGFDMAAGSSCAFGTEVLALRVSDTEILGGYGRGPGSGKLFDVRRPGLLARFERCRIEGISIARGIHDEATVVFLGCSLVDLVEHDPAGLERPCILRDGCTTTLLARGERPPARDVDELFPGWRERLGR